MSPKALKTGLVKKGLIIWNDSDKRWLAKMRLTGSVKDVDLFKLKDLSFDLARKVDQCGVKPQYILYIERAGLFIAHEIASYFSCPFSGIYAKRTGTRIKSKLKFLIRYLPGPITHLLRQIELNSNMHKIKKERNVNMEVELPFKELNVLIVDDAVDTGFSLNSVLKYLRTNGYVSDKMKTAVLTTTQKNPISIPDITLFEQITLAFPWSFDSREYDEAWTIYKKIKESNSKR